MTSKEIQALADTERLLAKEHLSQLFGTPENVLNSRACLVVDCIIKAVILEMSAMNKELLEHRKGGAE